MLNSSSKGSLMSVPGIIHEFLRFMLHILSLINLTVVLHIFTCELHDTYIIVCVNKELQWI